MSLFAAFLVPAWYPGDMTVKDFENYLRYIYTTDKGNPLSEASIRKYTSDSLNHINKNYVSKVSNGVYQTIYDIDSLPELREICDRITSDPEFRSLNARGNNMYSASLNRYIEFAEGTKFRGKRESTPLLDVPLPARYPISLSERTVPARDRIKVVQLAEACAFRCEIDPSHRTFITRKGNPFCEGHHIIPISHQPDFENSLDCYANIIILCPTCHRMFHYGRREDVEGYLHSLFDNREERYGKSGLSLSWPEFKDLTIRSDTFYSF